jgi:hypothetical protein
MVTLEQVKLLETKVIRAVEYVERLSRENSQLEGKVDSYQKRINDLEVLIQKFKEDQGRIEEGILASLERLNKFEDAIEKIAAVPQRSGPAPRETARQESASPSPRSGPQPKAPDTRPGEDDGDVTGPAADTAAPAQVKPESPEGLFPEESAADAASLPQEIPAKAGPAAEASPPADKAAPADSVELDIF